MSKTRIALIAGAVLLASLGIVVRAKRISPLSWDWYGPVQTTDGLAIRGYDPVAYRSGTAAEGNAGLSVDFGGATYRFATEANRAAFQADPSAYVPEFGGFCAYAASKGFTATIDPTAFRVHEGRLYLFNDSGMGEKWAAELDRGVIAKARDHWQAREAR